MQRILVIDDVGLWISLNRHFAGEGQIRISDATTLRTGIQLAAVEKPELIVCSGESTELSPQELSRMFQDAGVDESKVICVVESAASPSPSDDLKMRICSHDRFIEMVDQVMHGALEPKSHVDVDLLAHFDRLSAQQGEEARGFVNVLEIDGTNLLIECTIEMSLHEVIELNFFLPRFEHLGERHDRCQVSLSGEIQQCIDEQKLHFRFETRKIAKNSREYLEKFVATKRLKREGAT